MFYVISGAPCSGKSQYVSQRMGEKDVVFDADKLSRALTGRVVQDIEKQQHAERFVYNFRRAFINTAMDGEHTAENVWMIISDVSEKTKEWLRPLGPRYFKIKATKEECLRNLENDESRPYKEQFRKAIDEYFERTKTGGQ